MLLAVVALLAGLAVVPVLLLAAAPVVVLVVVLVVAPVGVVVQPFGFVSVLLVEPLVLVE